jgi:hypothetical protein
MLKRVHVDQHAIRANAKGREAPRPPISVKTYKDNVKAWEVEIKGPSRVVYRPDQPLSCGAKVWIECEGEVIADGVPVT